MSLQDRLVEFLEERRSWPWPEWSENGAPAKELYQAFVASLPEDYRVPTPQEFAPMVIEAGYPRNRTLEGHFYDGLTVQSRAERARAMAVSSVYSRLREQEVARHDAEYHPNGYGYAEWGRLPSCGHKMPDEVLTRLWAEARADEAGIAAMVERDYRPYLDWRPGQPNPGIALGLAEAERDVVRYTAELAAHNAQKVDIYAERGHHWQREVLHNRLRNALDWVALYQRLQAQGAAAVAAGDQPVPKVAQSVDDPDQW